MNATELPPTNTLMAKIVAATTLVRIAFPFYPRKSLRIPMIETIPSQLTDTLVLLTAADIKSLRSNKDTLMPLTVEKNKNRLS